jgi:glycosyltransferase involved in cell wall biosynthesis
MARILFYVPFNQRSRDTESLMIAFRRQGHEVTCLSQQEGSQIFDVLKANGVKVVSKIFPGVRVGWRYFMKHIAFFIRFCRSNKVDIVYSHLEPANFVASIAQHFIPAKVYLCRHHNDEAMLYKYDRDISYKITYRLASRVIVVSEKARRHMVDEEGVSANKLTHINLAYDFDLYDRGTDANVAAIRNNMGGKIVLLSVGRLTTYKRPHLAIRLLKALVVAGLDARLVILGQGEMKAELESLAKELELQDRVVLPGYVGNVLEYMRASDFLVYPSINDSSSVTVKEAGLVQLPVIICKGVGDFDDYISNGKNGFAVEPAHFVEEASKIIMANSDSRKLADMGIALNASIIHRFSIANVIQEYDALNKIGA